MRATARPRLKLLRAIPALPVSNLEASLAWYRDALHFTIGHQEGGFAIVKRDDVELHLWAATDHRWRLAPPADGASPVCSGAESFIAGTASCRIGVDAVDELYAELNDQIVHPNAALHDEPWAREFGVLDPDRNLVTFFQRR